MVNGTEEKEKVVIPQNFSNRFLSLPDEVFIVIFQCLGRPRHLAVLLRCCQRLYRKFEAGKVPRSVVEKSVSANIRIGSTWKSGTPESWRKWLNFLGPFHSIAIGAELTSVIPPNGDFFAEVFRQSRRTLVKVLIEVDDGLPNKSNESCAVEGSAETPCADGRQYERLIVAEMIGEPAVSYKVSKDELHVQYYKAMQSDVSPSISWGWSELASRNRDEQLLTFPLLEEVSFVLGPWSNDLQSLFDRVFSLLGEVRFLQWCRLFSKFSLPQVNSLSIVWGPNDWFLPPALMPDDLLSLHGETSVAFDNALISLLTRMTNLRSVIFSSEIRHHRSHDWYDRCRSSFAAFWRCLFFACSSTIEDIRIRASPGVCGALAKAVCLEDYFGSVPLTISCPNLKMFSAYPGPTTDYEVQDVNCFFQEAAKGDGVLVRQTQPYHWRLDRVSREVGNEENEEVEIY